MPITKPATANVRDASSLTWKAGQSWSEFYDLNLASGARPVTILVEGPGPRDVTSGVYDFKDILWIGQEPSPTITLDEGVEIGTVLASKNIDWVSDSTGTRHIIANDDLHIHLDGGSFTSGATAIPISSAGTGRVLLTNGAQLINGGVSVIDVEVSSTLILKAFSDSVTSANVLRAPDGLPSAASIFKDSSADIGGPVYVGVGTVTTTLLDESNFVAYDDSVSPSFSANTVQGALDALKPLVVDAGSLIMEWLEGEAWTDFYARYVAAGSKPARIIVRGLSARSITAGSYTLNGVLFANDENGEIVGLGGSLTFEDGAIITSSRLEFEFINVVFNAATASHITVPVSGNFALFLNSSTVSLSGTSTLSAVDFPVNITVQDRLFIWQEARSAILALPAVSFFEMGRRNAVRADIFNASSLDTNTFSTAFSAPVVAITVSHDATAALPVIPSAISTGTALAPAFFFQDKSFQVSYDDTIVPGPTLGTDNVQGAIDALKVTAPTILTAAGPYSVTDSDRFIVVKQSVPAPITIDLPDPTLNSGRAIIAKDGLGDAFTNNITLSTAVGTIDGAASQLITSNYGSVTLIGNGTDWNIV